MFLVDLEGVVAFGLAAVGLVYAKALFIQEPA